MTENAPCPCFSGDSYDACCGRFHTGYLATGDAFHWPGTAEALMRSRYSAFVTGEADYLLATWHPDTRPLSLELDGEMAWKRLDILAVRGGGPFDAEGVVLFEARYRLGGERGVQREESSFRRIDGRWYYLDAVD